MKNQLISVVNSTNFQRELTQNGSSFIQGGYELLARNIVRDILISMYPLDNFRSEVHMKLNGQKVAIDLAKFDNKGIMLEMVDVGHNGTFQTQTAKTGLINKTKQDIYKYTSRGIKNVYTLGVLTDIHSVDNLDLLLHYKDRIIKTKDQSLKRSQKIKTVKDSLEAMESSNGNILFHKSFPIKTSDYFVEPHIFICGPY